MKELWDSQLLRRLRSAHADSAPGAAWLARAARSWQRLKLIFQRTFPVGACLTVPLIWLTGGFNPQQTPDTILAAAGFASLLWCMGSPLLHSLTADAHLRVYLPELLILIPAPADWHAQRERRSRRMRMMLLLLLPLALATLTVAAWHFRQRSTPLPYHWTLAVTSALLLWLHALLLAAAAPLLTRKARTALQRLFRPGKLSKSLGIALSLLVAAIVILGALGPLMLAEKPWAREAGKALAMALPPAGILLWPLQPDQIPVWQIAFTAALLWPALPGIREWHRQWNQLPEVDLDMQARWESWYDGDEDGDTWPPEGEPESLSSAGPAPATSLAPSAQAGELRSALRALLAGGKWEPGRFLIPPLPALTIQRLMPGRGILLSTLGGLALGSVWGLPVPRTAGWLWLIAHAIWSPGLQWLQALDRPYHALQRGTAIHEWLPIQVQPSWRAAERHRNQSCVQGIVSGAIICGTGWAVSSVAALAAPLLAPLIPPRISPWPGHIPGWLLPVAAFLIICGAALVVRAVTPAQFRKRLNPGNRLLLLWRIFSLLLLFLTAASVACFGAAFVRLINDVFRLQAISPETLGVSAALLLTGELLRRLNIRGVFYQWAHAKKR